MGSNIFCAGFAQLSDGRILVAGGNAGAALDGTVQTRIFDWRTETWTRGKDMAAPRWYPSVAQTANGEEVIIGGGPATAEVYQTNGAIRALTSFTKAGGRLYPFLGSRPDTQLGLFGPYTTGYTINTAGNGAITATITRDAIHRDYGSFATYDIGKSLVAGGGSVTEGGAASVPTKTGTVISSGAGPTATVAATGSMSAGRRQFNATLLADGSVLATGGMTSAASSDLVDLDHPMTAAERWDPATGAWTVLASASRIRQYHSTASLLPDGRVMTGGGGICGICMTAGYLEKNVEYFTPPYLYKKDGSGELAARPVIGTAPASIGIGATVTVSTAQAASIKKVALAGLSDVTHSVNQGQRYVPVALHHGRHHADRDRPAQRRRGPARLLPAVRHCRRRCAVGRQDRAGGQGSQPADEPGQHDGQPLHRHAVVRDRHQDLRAELHLQRQQGAGADPAAG